MKNKKIIISVIVILLIIASFPCYNYLKTKVLWKNIFELKYDGAYSSYGKNEDGKREFLGWKCTLKNKTNDTYELEYVYVYAEPIITSGKTVKIKTYKTVYPNSSVEIQISKEDLLEAFGLDSIPIWGDVSIKGFDYKKK